MSYQIDVSPDVQKVIPTLPGNIRQRIRRAISSLAQDPRPSRSKKLEFSLVDGEPRRLRLEKWRILYVIIETDIKLCNLDANPDPIARDNIMFSAFLGDVLNIYEAA
ncbi:MAG: hypothetical protein SVT56_13455, partial [Chloroflexota bacterium]|nr:hypothetical protein [Chloroflexota bacterium]